MLASYFIDGTLLILLIILLLSLIIIKKSLKWKKKLKNK